MLDIDVNSDDWRDVFHRLGIETVPSPDDIESHLLNILLEKSVLNDQLVYDIYRLGEFIGDREATQLQKKFRKEEVERLKKAYNENSDLERKHVLNLKEAIEQQGYTKGYNEGLADGLGMRRNEQC